MREKNKKNYLIKGLIDSIPVALAYFFVSFAFGIMAMSANLSILEATVMSLTNLTSAGQYEGITIIAAGGSMLEMIICQVVINSRYSLMAISLSQKLHNSFTPFHRILTSFGITDEIFAIAYSNNDEIRPSYMYGLEVLPIFGWTFGTFLGGLAGNFLPVFIVSALNIMLFGMFISIIVTPCKKEPKVLIAIIIAILFSVLFRYIITFVNPGLAVVISSIIAAVITALIFPINEEGDNEE